MKNWWVLALLVLAGCSYVGAQQNPTGAAVLDTTAIGKLRVIFPDIGQGEAVIIQTQDNKTIVYDCGPSGERFLQALGALNITRINLLIVSHAHADHLGGCIGVLNTLKVDRVVDSNEPYDTKTVQAYFAARSRAAAYEQVAADSEDRAFPFLQYLVAYDDRGVFSDNLNDNSVVVRLVHGNAEILLEGDCETACEKTLRNTADIRADVLAMGHHGSKSSSSAYALEEVKPAVAVISVGKNSYGLPTKEAISRVARYTTNIFRTDSDGTIVVETDGSTITVSNAKGLLLWKDV